MNLIKPAEGALTEFFAVTLNKYVVIGISRLAVYIFVLLIYFQNSQIIRCNLMRDIRFALVKPRIVFGS